jgi:hypothetical protein
VRQYMLRLRHMFTTFVIQAFTAPFLPQDSMISIGSVLMRKSNTDFGAHFTGLGPADSWTPRPTLRAGCLVGM